MPENPDVMTVEEVAEYLRISERTVYDWAQKGEIPGGKIGSSWRFSRKRIEEWLNDRLSGSHHARTSLTATINLVGFWKPEHTLIINSPISKPAIIDKLIDLLSERDEITDSAELREAIFRREELMSTGIGLGIAVPHARLASVKDIAVAGALLRHPIPDYGSLDDLPVALVFLIAAGHRQHQEHLKILSAISTVCKAPLWRERLLAAPDAATFYRIITGQEESEHAS